MKLQGYLFYDVHSKIVGESDLLDARSKREKKLKINKQREKKTKRENHVVTTYCLESKSITRVLDALLDKHLPVLVDDGGAQQDTGTGANGANEIGKDRDGAQNGTTKGGSGGDDTLQLLVHGGITMASHDHVLVLELLGNVAGGGARDLNPGLGQEGAGSQHEGDVDDGVDGVQEGLSDAVGRRHVVGESTGSDHLVGALVRSPGTEDADEDVFGEAVEDHLGDHEHVGGQGRLQHDRHVGGVEQLNGVGATLATETGRLDGKLNTETLEVDDNAEDEDGSQQVHDVGEVVAVEGLLQGTGLVGAGEEQVEESDQGTLELGAVADVVGGGAESLPEDGLADVSGDEERDTRSQSVTLLQELIQEDNNDTGNNQLENQKQANTSAQLRGTTVQSVHN